MAWSKFEPFFIGLMEREEDSTQEIRRLASAVIGDRSQSERIIQDGDKVYSAVDIGRRDVSGIFDPSATGYSIIEISEKR